MENQALTDIQTLVLAAQAVTWVETCAQEDETFNLDDYEINFCQRPSGVVDMFYRSTVENPYTSEPSFHVGYAYPNGTWVEICNYR